MARFGELLTAMVTPFTDDLAVDFDGAARLAQWMVEQGNDGLVVAGTTGEAPTLTDDEHLELAQVVCAAVTVPVLVGSGSNDTAHAIEMTAALDGIGAAGALVVSPYYNKPPQAGIEAHYRAVAAATKLPVMLYDVPGRTGRRIAHDVIVRLAHDVDNIVALKDATGDVAGTARVVADTPDDFEVYCGDGPLTLPMLSVGAVGLVGVSTHWTAPEYNEMIRSFLKGDIARAREINARLIESEDFVNSDTCVFSMSAKAMLRTLGQPAGECRPPLGPCPPGTEDRAREVLARLRG